MMMMKKKSQQKVEKSRVIIIKSLTVGGVEERESEKRKGKWA